MEWQKPPPRNQGNHQQFKQLPANLAAIVISLGAFAQAKQASYLANSNEIINNRLSSLLYH